MLDAVRRTLYEGKLGGCAPPLTPVPTIRLIKRR